MSEYTEYRSSRTVEAYRVTEDGGESVTTATGPVLAPVGAYVVRESVSGPEGPNAGQYATRVVPADSFQAEFEVPDDERDSLPESTEDDSADNSSVSDGTDSGDTSEDGSGAASDNADEKSGGVQDDPNADNAADDTRASNDDSPASRVRRASSSRKS